MENELLLLLNSINENLIELNLKIDSLRSDIGMIESNTSMNDIHLESISGEISSIADSVTAIESQV
ncbi:hypothetical protein P7D86_18095 [Enterococcus avium]|uniref:hypothetical protein n=1 Tax=Enterococcus avium TaxID=33945 RepID=UPI0028918D03|nr:hypothetical protein [Enterococcus avium]MDT2428744.1 hypothetical protein [Enterococcus avium]